MRGWKAALAVLVVLVGALGVWRLWPTAPPTEPAASVSTQSLEEDFTEVEVRAPPGQSGLTLRGRIQDTSGAPIPGAEVHLVAAHQPRLGLLQCPWKEAKLLGCETAETAALVRGLLQKGQGVLRPAMTVHADASGAFVFEGLAGVSFTVWASAPGFGPALVDRAAPGDAVTLVLPGERALTGRVVDDTGRRLSGVEVWAVSRKLSLGQSTVSDARGDFRFDGLGEGPFYVLASAEGLLPGLNLSASPSGPPLELRLRTPRSLQVRVLREGEPTSAVVQLDAFHLNRTLEVGDSGTGRFELLELREVAVRAHEGALASDRVVVQLSGTENVVELHLMEGGTLWVTATDTEGQPVPEVELALHQSRTGEIGRQTATRGEGVRFGPFAPGDYWLGVTAKGYESQWLPVRIDSNERTLELELVRGTVISGRVLDMYGRGAAGVSVLAQPIGESALADASGAFTITVPSAGQYVLSAHHSDWGGVERVVQAPIEDVQLSLEPGASIEVRVELDGRPVEGASVRAWADPRTIFTSDTLSGPDGVVWMRGMEPGTYTLFATHPRHVQSENLMIPLADGDERTVTASLRPGAAVEGDVVDTEGRPIPHVLVYVNGVAIRDESDADGRFRLEGLDESRPHDLLVHHHGFDLSQRTRVRAGQKERVRLELQARETYRGRVVSASGRQLTHFTVDAQRFSNPDGHFEVKLRPMVQGESPRVMVAIEAPGHTPFVEDFPADQRELGTLTLQAAPQLKGRVVNASGSPVRGATVSCRECSKQALSEADGSFELEIPEDVERLWLTASRGRQSTELEVAPRSGPVELTLEEAATLEGVLLDGQGVPLSGSVLAIAGGGGDTQIRVSGEGGRFTHSGAPAVLRIAWGMSEQQSPPLQIVRLPEEGLSLTLGRAPGTARVTAEAPTTPGWMLALVRGALPPEGSLLEWVMHAEWAQLAQRVRSPQTHFDGVPPGQYTLIYMPTYAQGREDLQVRHLTVRGDTQVAFERGGRRRVGDELH